MAGTSVLDNTQDRHKWRNHALLVLVLVLQHLRRKREVGEEEAHEEPNAEMLEGQE